MNRTRSALKIRDQISRFMGIFYPHSSKPKQRFIEQMIFGLLAGKDVKLSSISRKLDEPVKLKKTEERLSRHLNTLGMDQTINTEIASAGSRKVHIRLIGTRHLRYRGKNRRVNDLAESCPMLYRDQIVKETREGEKTYQIEYGFRRVKMPGKKPWLYLVVVKGFGQKPMMLLTTEEVIKSRKSIWFIVEGYISRWLVEDAIRFIKQSYKLEDIRVLSYQRLQNMMALVLAAIYFSAVWLGNSVKLAVLSAHAIKASKRFFGIAEFHYYALADGIAALLSRIGASRIPAHVLLYLARKHGYRASAENWGKSKIKTRIDTLALITYIPVFAIC